MQNSPVQGSPSTVVTAKEIAQSLHDASDPLDFITRNLQNPTTPSTVEVPRPQESPQPTTPPVQATPPPTNEPPPLIQEPPKPEESNELLSDFTKTQKGPADSIKDLRKKANEYKNQVEEKETALSQLKEELEKYKTGEALPDVVKQKEARISELSKYERLHALKLSPEYQKKYVEPLTDLKTKALALAQDYNVEPDILNEALEIDSKRELNSYLREHFDDMGAMEVRDLITQIKGLSKEAQEAEKEPVQAFEKIKEEYRREQQSAENYRVNTIANNAQNAWVEALTELRERGDYPELEASDATAPIIQGATEEYGKFITLLGINGLKELPPEAAKILAKRFALSQAVAITARSRAAHYERAQDLLKTTQRQSSMLRPQVGGGVSSSGELPPKPQSPKEAAEALLNQVLQKR